ncbi:serine/threonine-protein kinase [Candidatus Uabimicrobium amorphum]|uniref:non-specific serine/threonine protein kinase n=1 Tax=Uabimicrobium amorphum TaxID=2596890 RepID=A0A5S9F3B6_UABAM|nr:serine/threonine-protein kinase [Candidatus Uabimicrobium amorphum]BBM84575.1 protein kinase [Candidatus Uabimicrobium amorphum]
MNKDVKFGQIALSNKMIDTKILTHCMSLLQSNPQRTLSDILLEEGFLNNEQVAQIQTQITQNNIPQQIGRYKILHEIGRGGMGIIYKAKDPLGDRDVAIKVLLRSSHENNLRFIREAKATARLQHPNIVTLHDIGQDGDKYFFTMDFVNGVPLDHFVKTDSSIPTRKIAALMIKICNAIHFAHQQGIIHRDIKPANIMMDENEEPKVMDFGLAKLQDASQKLSVTGSMIGTIFYMPPEQVEGKIGSIDQRSDVYSLGALFYTLLAGRPPFSGNTITQVSQQILHKDPLPPSSIKQIVPKPLDFICAKALAKDKNMRYRSAKELGDDIEKFLRGEKIARDKLQRQRKFYKWVEKHLVLILLFTIVCSVGITIFISSYRNLRFKYKNLVYNTREMTNDERLFIQAFNFFIDNKRDSGWELIKTVCERNFTPRYHLLKALYIRLMTRHDEDERVGKILKVYLPKANVNNKYMSYIKGRLYMYGAIEHQDRAAQAIKSYEYGAAQKFAPCIESIANIYLRTPRFKKEKQALKMFLEVSDQYHWASYFVARMYEEGIGTEKNINKALVYRRQSAKQGNSASMVLLGDMFLEKNNTDEAIKWYQKAIDTDKNAFAMFALGKIYLAQKDNLLRGLKLLWKSCESDVPGAHVYLAKNYMYGKLLGRDYRIARMLLVKERKNGEAYYLLGKIFANGWRVKKDKKRAEKLYQKAVSLGYDTAKEKLNK